MKLTAHRCLTFTMEQAEENKEGGASEVREEDPAQGALDNQKFWDKLQSTFQLTFQMIQQEAQRRGIDLNAPELEAEAVAHERQVHRRAARHKQLARAAQD